MRRLYFVGQGGSSWRDPRNWALSPGGQHVRHLHMRGDETVAIGAVAGHDRLDLRGMPHESILVTGYEGRLRLPDGSRVNFPRSRLGRLRSKFLKRGRVRPRMLRGLDDAIARAGGWERAVRDGIATLVLTPRRWMVVPLLAGGTPALVSAGAVAANNGSTSAAAPTYGVTPTVGNLLVATVQQSTGNSGGNFTNDNSVSGWTRQVQDTSRSQVGTAIFYKVCDTVGETAPTFKYSSNASVRAALWEFSGTKVVSPVDRSSSANAAGTVSLPPAPSAVNAAADVEAPSVVVTSDSFSFSSNYTHTSSDGYNNGATPTTNRNNDSTSTQNHFRMAYGITTGNSVADRNDLSTDKTGTASVASTSLVSFKAAADRSISVTGLTVTTSLASRRVRAVTDTGVSVTDSIAKIASTNISDTGATVTDSLAAATPRTASITDTGLTVTDSIQKSATKSLTDTGVTVTDALSREEIEAISDVGLVVSDSLRKTVAKFMSDTGLSVTDATAPTVFVTLTDQGATVTDSTATLRLRLRVLTDTGLTISDGLASVYPRSLTDIGVTVSDAIGSQPTRVVAIADTGLTVSDSFGPVSRSVAITDTGLTISDSLRVPDFPGFAVGTDVPAYAAASAIIATDRAEGTAFATYGSAINDQPGGLP